ncbi:MAG: hypothetical protein IJP98_05150 [Clostridia bacterium]|nr:hypothetical protein [Clostridia bacterium]
MKQFSQSNPKAQTYAACACFACAGLVAAALEVPSVLFVLAPVLSISLLGLIRLVRTGAYAV